jgi:hypothetical protein
MDNNQGLLDVRGIGLWAQLLPNLAPQDKIVQGMAQVKAEASAQSLAYSFWHFQKFLFPLSFSLSSCCIHKAVADTCVDSKLANFHHASHFLSQGFSCLVSSWC